MTSGCHGDHILYTIGWRSRSAFSRKSLRFQWQIMAAQAACLCVHLSTPGQQSHASTSPKVAQVASPQLWNPPKDWWKTCQETHGVFTTVEIVGVPLHCSIIQFIQFQERSTPHWFCRLGPAFRQGIRTLSLMPRVQ